MREQLKKQIISLCSTPSVSGFESRATQALRQTVAKDFDEMTTDAVGNHIFWKRSGKQDAVRILIDTHFDEIGMMVTEICEGGFLRLTSVGGLSPSVLQASDVLIYGEQTLRGVITSTPPHLRSTQEDELADLNELMVDTGYPQEELAKIVPLGTPVGFAPEYSELNGGMLAGKSFDNKACAAIAAAAIASLSRDELAGDVALLFSAFEETSRIGGAGPASLAIDPDYAMVIDVNLGRIPDAPKSETVPMAGGVSLALSAATDFELTRATQKLCEEKEIAHTMVAAPSSTGTNATTVNLVGAGIPTVDVGLPLRNMHTYNEVISLEDAESLYKLVRAFACDGTLANRFARVGKEELPL